MPSKVYEYKKCGNPILKVILQPPITLNCHNTIEAMLRNLFYLRMSCIVSISVIIAHGNQFNQYL